MEKYCFEILDKKIYLYTDSEKVINKIKDEKSVLKTVPCKINYLGKSSLILEKENTIVCLNNFLNRISLSKQNNVAFINILDDKLFFPDIVYLMMCMFANIFQKENKYFLQASAVKTNETDSVVFIGDPGSGKTTLSYLLAKDTKGKIISNDNVLIGEENNKILTYKGTDKVQMRLGAMKLFCPELLKNIEYEENKNPFDIKIYMDDILKDKNILFDDESIIKKIYFISTTQNADVNIRIRERIDNELLIYEHLTKQIRSNRYVFTSLDYPLPSFEIEDYLQQRYQLVKKIVDNVEIFEAKGDPLKLLKRIERDI